MPIQDNYRVPSEKTDPKTKLGWVKEAIEQGTSFVKSTRASVDMEQAIDIISGFSTERIPDGRSKIEYNKLKRQIREIVAVSSSMRAVEGFQSENPALQSSAYVLNKLWLAWWDNTFVDREIRKAKQWAAATGTGWLSPTWQNDFWVAGRGDIALQAYSAGQVLPVQMPMSGDIQQAYAVTIHGEMPLAMAHGLYPEYQDKITADRTQPGFFKRMTERFMRSQSPVLRLQEKRGKAYPFPICDIYYTYITDLSVNTTGEIVPMGDPGTSWYYEVPPYGSDIPVQVGPDGKTKTYRKATMIDSMLYPLRRLMISFSDCVVYDGTSKWFHGKYPLVKFTCDDWPWEPLGFPLTKDGAGLQAAITRLLRNIDDNANVRMDPPLQYGESIAKTTMENIDLRAPGVRIQNPEMSMGTGEIKAILDPAYYDIPPWIVQILQDYDGKMDYLLATRDAQALARAAQIPSSDSIEKIFEMSGPITQDIVRSDERSVVDLAKLWMPLSFQFYTGFRTMQMLGSDGVTKEQFDFKPGDLVPSHIEGEDKQRPSKYSNSQRARMFMNNVFYQITKGSVYQSTNMSRKLLYAQLQKIGFPIDWWTLAEIWEVANFGNPPQGTTTVLERYVAQQFMQAELQKEIQGMLMAAAQGGAALPTNPNDALQTARNFMDKVLNKSQEGRPPSFNAPPEIATKDNGLRSTITTS